MKEIPTKGKIRSFVNALEDQRLMEEKPFLQARRDLVQQIDAVAPDMESVRENTAAVLSVMGSDGCFDRDSFTKLSVIDALEANKNRPAAKEAVDFVAAQMKREIGRENRSMSEQRKRSDAVFSGR